MNIKIAWMYHDIMNLYGDKGNIMVLKKRCEERGISTTITHCDIGDDIDLSSMDLVVFGGGADKEQSVLIDDLKQRRENIVKALEQGTLFILICGGFQLFGQYYIDANGKRIDGLGIYDYYTVSGKPEERCVGNVVIESQIEQQTMTLVGFENHGGQTYGIKQPLGKVIVGHGNNSKEKIEGFYDGRVLGTYLHGPLLPRNPELADVLIARCLHKQGRHDVLSPLDDTMEKAAKDAMLKRLWKP